MSLDEEWESAGMAPTALTAKVSSDAKAPVAKGSSNSLRPTVAAEGTTLRELTRDRLLDQHHALMIVREVLDALATLHADRRRHGDISPENILVLPGLGNNRVKLTGENPKSSDPRYTAPEHAFGAADARADIYAVGAVLFELLTGYPPFIADDTNALRRLHAYAPVQTLEQRAPTLAFHDALEDIVARALAKKRDARFQTTTDMIEAIDSACTALEAAAPPKPASEEPRRKHDDSLLLFAHELMPSATSAQNEPLVPLNIDRRVPELPWTSRATIQLRRLYARARDVAVRLHARFRALDRRKQITIASVSGLVLLLLAIVTCSDGGNGDTKPTPTATHAAAPEKALSAATPAVDAVAASVEKLDRATSCEERRAAIAELADSSDERALPALKRAKKHKCVAKAAAAAIQKLTAAPKQQ